MKLIFIVIPLLIFSFFIFQGVNLPYVGPNATNDNGYSLIAHNLNKYGYLATWFAPVTSVAPTLPEHPTYFFHHPNMLSFTESIFFKVFGEGFWVGRLTVITFAFGSFLLLFLIAKKIGNKKYALIVLGISSLIPALSIYGKLLGHEPLVLFYALLTIYLLLNYFYSDKKRFLIFAYLSTVLGTLSDWPTTYFLICFIPFFMKHKKINLFIFFFLFSTLTAIGVLIQIAVIFHGLESIQQAIALRSISGLLSTPLWPLRWLGTTIIRLFIYLNPLLCFLSVISLITIYKTYKKRKLKDQHLVILGFFLFGTIHLLLYTQASFSHPYFIYYLMPFIVLGSSMVLEKLFRKKAYLYFTLIVGFSIWYLFIITSYKQIQITSNLWRYELTRVISKYLSPYEQVAINGLSIINTDVLWYRFSVNTSNTDDVRHLDTKKYSHYLHSCDKKCKPDDIQLAILKKRYKYIYFNSEPHAQAYLFFLQEKVSQQNGEDQKPLREVKIIDSNNSHSSSSLILSFYRVFRDILYVPQL